MRYQERCPRPGSRQKVRKRPDPPAQVALDHGGDVSMLSPPGTPEQSYLKPCILGGGIPVFEITDQTMFNSEPSDIISDGPDAEDEWEAPDLFVIGKPVPRRLVRSVNSHHQRQNSAEIIRELRETNVIGVHKAAVSGISAWEQCDRGATYAHKPPFRLAQLDVQEEKRKLRIEEVKRICKETAGETLYHLPPLPTRVEPRWKTDKKGTHENDRLTGVLCVSPDDLHMAPVKMTPEPWFDDQESKGSRNSSRKPSKIGSLSKVAALIASACQSETDIPDPPNTDNLQLHKCASDSRNPANKLKIPIFSSEEENQSPEVFLEGKDSFQDIKISKTPRSMGKDYVITRRTPIRFTDSERYECSSRKGKKKNKCRRQKQNTPEVEAKSHNSPYSVSYKIQTTESDKPLGKVNKEYRPRSYKDAKKKN